MFCTYDLNPNKQSDFDNRFCWRLSCCGKLVHLFCVSRVCQLRCSSNQCAYCWKYIDETERDIILQFVQVE